METCSSICATAPWTPGTSLKQKLVRLSAISLGERWEARSRRTSCSCSGTTKGSGNDWRRAAAGFTQISCLARVYCLATLPILPAGACPDRSAYVPVPNLKQGMLPYANAFWPSPNGEELLIGGLPSGTAYNYNNAVQPIFENFWLFRFDYTISSKDSFSANLSEGYLRRRHQVHSRGTTRFSRAAVYGQLGVVQLRRIRMESRP